MSSTPTQINGDTAPLLVDRAIGELRRGRAVALVDGARHLLVAAVEALQPQLLQRLDEAATALRLFLTAERGLAAGLGGDDGGAIVVELPRAPSLETLRALAGVDALAAPEIRPAEVIGRHDPGRLVAAAFKLAKVGRLLPAVVGFEAASPADASVLAVPVDAVERHAGPIGHRLKRSGSSLIPLSDAGESEVSLFRDEHGLSEHVAVVIGNPDRSGVLPVRLHSACLTGDVLGSLRCDCGEQLRAAVSRIAELGGGVLLYLDQEGRGIGLANKLRAYKIQSTGLDTFDANRHLGFDADERNFDIAAALLRELGVSRIKLLTNNPRKISALREHGIEVVGRIPLIAPTNLHNERYLEAKRRRAGHLAEEPAG